MRYLNGPAGDLVDTVLARQTSGGTVAWYLPDRLGTIRDLINNSGSIIDHVDYSAFGTVLDESSPSNGDRMMGFAGMERDTVTGLNLAVNRVENPGTGRWTSQDPLGFAAGDANLYRYVGNRPTEVADPSGLQAPQQNLGHPTLTLVAPGFPIPVYGELPIDPFGPGGPILGPPGEPQPIVIINIPIPPMNIPGIINNQRPGSICFWKNTTILYQGTTITITGPNLTITRPGSPPLIFPRNQITKPLDLTFRTSRADYLRVSFHLG